MHGPFQRYGLGEGDAAMIECEEEGVARGSGILVESPKGREGVGSGPFGKGEGEALAGEAEEEGGQALGIAQAGGVGLAHELEVFPDGLAGGIVGGVVLADGAEEAAHGLGVGRGDAWAGELVSDEPVEAEAAIFFSG